MLMIIFSFSVADFSVLEICQKETNSYNSAIAALASELLVNIAVAGIKSGLFYNLFSFCSI